MLVGILRVDCGHPRCQRWSDQAAAEDTPAVNIAPLV